MATITLYLDDETESRLIEAARAAAISPSDWIARQIEEKTRSEWPHSVRRLVGAWSADIVQSEDGCGTGVADIPREAV